MIVQFNSDNATDISGESGERVETMVRDHLDRFSDRLTRVEVHAGDADAKEAAATDKQCTIEARPAGLEPVSVTAHASDVTGAVSNALDKLTKVLERQFGKLTSRKGH